MRRASLFLTCVLVLLMSFASAIAIPTKSYVATDRNRSSLISASDVLCGDADLSGQVDIDDVLYILEYIFSGPVPGLLCQMDADGSGRIDIDDVVYLIGYIFASGSAPVFNCCNPPW